jgi:hypothetical protein
VFRVSDARLHLVDTRLYLEHARCEVSHARLQLLDARSHVEHARLHVEHARLDLSDERSPLEIVRVSRVSRPLSRVARTLRRVTRPLSSSDPKLSGVRRTLTSVTRTRRGVRRTLRFVGVSVLANGCDLTEESPDACDHTRGVGTLQLVSSGSGASRRVLTTRAIALSDPGARAPRNPSRAPRRG